MKTLILRIPTLTPTQARPAAIAVILSPARPVALIPPPTTLHFSLVAIWGQWPKDVELTKWILVVNKRWASEAAGRGGWQAKYAGVSPSLL